MTFKIWVDGLVHGANIIVIPVLFGLATAVFVFGIVKYFFISVDSEQGREQGRQFVLWGLLGMLLLFTAWGVVYILLDTLGFQPA